MADNNQLKASQIDFAQDDPFAELTRIMGFDPREPVRKPDPAPSAQPTAQQQAPASYAQPEDDDFSLDLEKELLGGFVFEDEPAQPPVNHAAAEQEHDDFLPPAAADFDFAADFDAAMAAESFDAPYSATADRVNSDAYEAPSATAHAHGTEDDFDLGLSDEDLQSLGAFEVAPAADRGADTHIDFDLASALSDLDNGHSPSGDAVTVSQQPAHAAEEPDFDFFEDDDAFRLAEEVPAQPRPAAEPEAAFSDLEEAVAHPAPDLRAQPEAEFDESPFHFSDDEFRFDDLPPVENLVPAPPARLDDQQPAEDLAFDEIDFDDGFSTRDGRHDDYAAPSLEVPAPQAVEPPAAAVAPQPFEFAVPAFVPRKLPTSPMDIAAEEFRQREAVAAPQPEFNLEDELNALLGNSRPKASAAPEPLPTAPVEAHTFKPSLGPAFQPYTPAPSATAQIDAPEHPAEMDDNLNWEFDDNFAAEAAPQLADANETAAPAYEAARYDAGEDLAIDLDDAFDDLAASEPEQPYRDAFVNAVAGAAAGAAAGATARGMPDFAARPFATPSFQPSPSYGAAASGQNSPLVSSHRDPVVRGDPLKEDPLNVITQLAEQYSRKEPVSYGHASGTSAAYRDDDIEDDLDISYDFDDQPEIDTIEVTDRAVALADDFDIPELPEDDHVPQTAAYDDIDAEFSSLLNELNAEQKQAAQPVSDYNDPLAGGFQPQPPYQTAQAARTYAQRPTASAAPPRDVAPEHDAFSLDMDEFAGSQNGGDRASGQGMHYADDYQFENEFDQDMVPGRLAEENSRRPIPRKLLIGGLIAGVALIGGLGAFAFSFGGGSSGAPELVRAEDGPVKVRPENPGGATVPNQENKVYERVAGQGNADGTGQESLVTTAEEPLDVTPPADDENLAVSGKGEDRIEQILEDTEGQSDAELAAVAPRKVRTMVVRPDGTLVEREGEPGTSNEQTDTIPTASAPATEGIPGVTQDIPALAPVPGETDTAAMPAAPVARETTGSTPDTAPIAPLRPAEQPIDVVGEVKPDQVAAATTAAAAAGTWAMQIASQPNEAAAQSSYQDLARRYGSVLGGRPVNIVKAEIAGRGTFWRVRVPANTRNEAIALCEQYKAAGGSCFVSR